MFLIELFGSSNFCYLLNKMGKTDIFDLPDFDACPGQALHQVRANNQQYYRLHPPDIQTVVLFIRRKII